MKQLTGTHVFVMFAAGFGTIIAVNLTLAWTAVSTFPGLEVKNSYVASQSYDRDRAAQEALGWDVAARLNDGQLALRFEKDGVPVRPVIEQAVFGQATSVAADQRPKFVYRNGVFLAPVEASTGNLNLRVVALAEDGTRFRQRIVVELPR